MKQFLVKNWYKLMIGSSLLMASFGFMVQSITPANANKSNGVSANLNYKMVPVNNDGTISVKLSDEQLNRIIPKNEDGSISIKLSEQQLKAIAPKAVQDVDVKYIDGWAPAHQYEYTIDGRQHHSLGTVCYNCN